MTKGGALYNRYFVTLGAKVEGSSVANPLFYAPSAGFLHFARGDKWRVRANSSFSLPAREVVQEG